MTELSKHQNFAMSAGLRDFTPYQISQLSEEECHKWFVTQRFGDTERFACPKCGVVDKHYYRTNRRQWRCKHCDTSFSCTSGTPFQDRKMPFKKLLLCLVHFAISANGISSIHLSQNVDIQVKTALAFQGKVREAIARNCEKMQLGGVVELDGGHFGGKPRSGRIRKKARKSAVAAKAQADINYQNRAGPKPRSIPSKANLERLKKRRIAFVMRRHSGTKGFGADKTFVFIVSAETAVEVAPYIKKYVTPGAVVMTDESNAYHNLSLQFTHRTVNHQIEYSSKEGYNENQAESYFSRLRRYYLGVAHKSEPKYMLHIGLEMAWREDLRRATQLEKCKVLCEGIFSTGLSRLWRGYWQGIAQHTSEAMVIASSGLAL